MGTALDFSISGPGAYLSIEGPAWLPTGIGSCDALPPLDGRRFELASHTLIVNPGGATLEPGAHNVARGGRGSAVEFGIGPLELLRIPTP